MINFRNKKSQNLESAQSELLPWLMHANPEWMLCKDGSLLCGFEYSGLDVDNIEPHTLVAILAQLQHGLSKLDERFYLWWTVDKRLATDYRKVEFPDAATQKIDDEVRKLYQQKQVYNMKFRMYLLYTGETGVFAFMDNVRRLINEENKGFVTALLLSLNPSKTAASAVLFDSRQLDQNLLAATSGAMQFVSSVSSMEFKQLSGWDLDNALIQSANITLPLDSSYKASPDALFDGVAALSDIKIGREVVSCSGPNGNKFSANLSLHNYPGNIQTGFLEKLYASNLEFRFTHVMRCLGQDVTKKTLSEAVEYYNLARSSMLQRAVAKATGTPAAVDPGKQELYEECLQALGRTNLEDLTWLYHGATLTVIDASLAGLEDRLNDVQRLLSDVPLIRERVGLKASFASVLPGQWALQNRLMLVNAEVACDAAPIFTLGSGDAYSPHFSAVFGTDVHSMSVFKTIYNTQYNFNPHVGQVGHALLVMPTGGGKTTFANFALAQFRGVRNAQVIVFDRNASCRIVTGAVGGTHVDLKAGGVRLNPMNAIKDGEMGRLWAREFLLQRLVEGGYSPTAAERNHIDAIILTLADSPQPISLSTVTLLLPQTLREAFAEWRKGGPYGMFDNEDDDLSFNSWTCIEMKDILSVDRLARAFLDHSFRVISKNLDGRPTFIYLEEASFLLNSPSFLSALDEWLKTFRKKNAFVWMTIQSPESVAGIEDEKIRATLADNVPNLILGHNARLENHRDLYKKMFAMTDSQVNLLSGLVKKRDYLLVADGFCRVMRTQFSKDMLLYLRSEQNLQNLYDEALKRGDADWFDWYLTEAKRRFP